ncbi:hypothetical protein [Streptomyces sp. NBC_00690]|uniref:hypothetical protein n=1 Tax=Streptomyces sp. NBC_00690 TaxID=2975808 RepID=UPI002E2B5973|nr:hypothetical protein [Streptomyces sp. NBC_00690]
MSIPFWPRRTLKSTSPDTDSTHPVIVKDERIPSQVSSVFFTVGINGAWRPTDGEASDHHQLATQARHHLRQRVGRVLVRHSVLHLAAAQDAANTALMPWQSPDTGPELTGSVQLTASPQDRDLAEKHLRQRRTADLEHENELNRLAHLQHVLADPDLRRVWWIAQYPDRFSELDQLAQALEGLASPYEPEEDGVRSDIRRFTEQLVTVLHTPEQLHVFLKALTQALRTLGHHDLQTSATRWQTQEEPGSTPP